MMRGVVDRWWRVVALGAVMTLLAAACGDDGDEAAPPTDPYPSVAPSSSSSAPTTTESPTPTAGSEGPTTTTSAPSSTGRVALVDNEIASDDGTTGSYELFVSADGALCFTGDVSNDDPAIDLGLGSGISECLEEWTPLDETLSVSVGTLDGDKRYGVVWGRTIQEIDRLELTFDDGSGVDVPLVDNDYGMGLFALVVDTLVTGGGQTLDAYDADGSLRESETIRGFLRAGPTYPTVTPVTLPPTTYPTAGG